MQKKQKCKNGINYFPNKAINYIIFRQSYYFPIFQYFNFALYRQQYDFLILRKYMKCILHVVNVFQHHYNYTDQTLFLFVWHQGKPKVYT